MKTQILILCMGLASVLGPSSARAGYEDELNRVEQVRQKNENSFQRTLRFEGSMIGGCDPSTGREPAWNGDIAPCWVLVFYRQDTFDSAVRTQGQSFRYQGIWVRLEMTEPFRWVEQ